MDELIMKDVFLVHKKIQPNKISNHSNFQPSYKLSTEIEPLCTVGKMVQFTFCTCAIFDVKYQILAKNGQKNCIDFKIYSLGHVMIPTLIIIVNKDCMYWINFRTFIKA